MDSIDLSGLRNTDDDDLNLDEPASNKVEKSLTTEVAEVVRLNSL